MRDLERLEFLGDRVLGLLTAEELWRRFPDMDEGGLAPRLNAMVRKETCAEAARALGLGAALILAPEEERDGGREKTAILGDACEALLGALYVDGGLDAARRAYEFFWARNFEDLANRWRDAKTELQEWAQGVKRGTPRYRMVSAEGPDHAPRFVVEAVVDGLKPARGEGGSKRAAQTAAAKAMLAREGVSNDN